ncbi:MAG: FCD domain-containing protein [Streptosporangiales bacterium]|nr:FCD domain-containing protein [Streptosporangiales bacterium]
MISATRMGEQIAAQLRHEIIAGDLRPGDLMRLAPLAERFDVSITPVREALAVLERQGLVVGRPHRGFYVADLSPEDIEDVYALHAFMAGRLTEHAVGQLSDHELDELEKIDEEIRQATLAGDKDGAGDLNHELHRRIMQASGSMLLLRFLRETTPFVGRKTGSDVPGWAEVRIEGHRAIIDALRGGDGRLARALMEEHVLRSGRHAADFARAKRSS